MIFPPRFGEARDLRRISEEREEKPEAPKLPKPKKAEPVKEKVVFKEVNKKAVKRVVDSTSSCSASKATPSPRSWCTTDPPGRRCTIFGMWWTTGGTTRNLGRNSSTWTFRSRLSTHGCKMSEYNLRSKARRIRFPPQTEEEDPSKEEQRRKWYADLRKDVAKKKVAVPPPNPEEEGNRPIPTPPTARDARAEARELRRNEVEKPEAPKRKTPKKAEQVRETIKIKEVKRVKRVVDKKKK